MTYRSEIFESDAPNWDDALNFAMEDIASMVDEGWFPTEVQLSKLSDKDASYHISIRYAKDA